MVRAPEYRDVVLGVLAQLSMTQVVPGALGWCREIQLSGRPGTSRIYLVLRPATSKDRSEPPLIGIAPKELVVRHPLASDPSVELLLRSTDLPLIPRLREVAEAIRLELEAE